MTTRAHQSRPGLWLGVISVAAGVLAVAETSVRAEQPAKAAQIATRAMPEGTKRVI